MRLSSITLLALLVPLGALAQRPPAVVPKQADTVIERLPDGYAEVMPRVGAPPSPESALALLEAGARSGDARLIARADAVLARVADGRATPAHLRARAYVAQYRHDFGTALGLLDRTIQLDPRDGDARLARAQILLVQGKIAQARRECASLALGVDVSRGSLCIAAVALRRGEYDAAARLLERWLERAGPQDDARRHALVLRAEVASRRGDADADAWFRRALALDPRDVRTLAAMSRHLRGSDRPSGAYALLADAPASDHLLIERALAAQASGRDDAKALADSVARRFALSRTLGIEPDLRDEAEYALVLARDPAAALPLAERNFAEQRDYEDVELLRRAALAAGRPQAWRPVEAWARSQDLSRPVLQETAR
jgi:Tfp pilus assembly protein PilF